VPARIPPAFIYFDYWIWDAAEVTRHRGVVFDYFTLEDKMLR
jgi:hypothetical protein